VCDDGNVVNTDSCTNTCQHAVCGDAMMGITYKRIYVVIVVDLQYVAMDLCNDESNVTMQMEVMLIVVLMPVETHIVEILFVQTQKHVYDVHQIVVLV
jgi:hypothetical protein